MTSPTHPLTALMTSPTHPLTALMTSPTQAEVTIPEYNVQLTAATWYGMCVMVGVDPAIGFDSDQFSLFWAVNPLSLVQVYSDVFNVLGFEGMASKLFQKYAYSNKLTMESFNVLAKETAIPEYAIELTAETWTGLCKVVGTVPFPL
jgi:hypothetical protein